MAAVGQRLRSTTGSDLGAATQAGASYLCKLANSENFEQALLFLGELEVGFYGVESLFLSLLQESVPPSFALGFECSLFLDGYVRAALFPGYHGEGGSDIIDSPNVLGDEFL